MDELDEPRMKIAIALGYKFERMFSDEAKVYLMKPGEKNNPGFEMQSGDIVRWHSSDPDWLRKITDAWPLLEEMLAAEFSVVVGGNNIDGWSCVVVRMNKDPIILYASTAPEAISRVWLAWKESHA